MAYYWLGSTYDRQSRIAQSSQNYDQVRGTPQVLQGKDAFPPGQTTLDTRRPQAYLDRFTRLEATIASNADQVHATPRPLVGKDSFPPGQSTANTDSLPPRAPARSRDYTYTDSSEFWLFGTDKFPPGQSTLDTRRPAAYYARAYRYPVYDANSGNAFLPEQVVAFPPGQATLDTRRPVGFARPPYRLAVYDANSGNTLLPEEVAYSTTILAESGLLSYWPLNEAAGTTGTGSVIDYAPVSPFNGTPSNVTFGATPLIADGTTSASFPGTVCGISMGNNLIFPNTTPFSVEAWIDAPVAATGTSQVIVGCWHNDGSSQTQGWDLILDGSGNLRLQRWLNGTLQEAVHSAVLSDATTYYVAATYDGSTIRISVNAGGQETGASTQNIDPANTANFGIGAFDGGTFWYFGGRIGHVAAYSSVLSTSQISAHYAAGIGIQATLPAGQATFDTFRPVGYLARAYRYPVYDANSSNAILPEQVITGLPPGQSTVLSELPPRAASRSVDLLTYVDPTENWLFGTDAMATGQQSWELSPRRAPRLPDYTYLDPSEVWLFGTDAVNAGQQRTELPPLAATRARDYSWSQQLIPELVGQDSMVVGQQSYALPPSPAPLRLRDYSVTEAFPLVLISQDALNAGQQSTALPPAGPQRSRDYTFAPPVNLPTLTTVVQQIPYGAQLTDSLPPRAAPRLRDYTWSQDLIPDLIGQDATNTGQQSFALAPSPAPLRARDYSITESFPLELISQDAMAAGRQSFDLPPIAPLRARDYSFVPPANLCTLTTVVQPIPYGQQSTDSLPPRAAARARDYTYAASFFAGLNGQDAMVAGEQSTALAPRGPQRASTLSDPGINLTIAITVVPLPAGLQFTEVPPKAAQRARDYTHLDQTRRHLIGQDALPNGQNADRSALPPKAAPRARDYSWLQSMPLYIFQQLPTGHSTAPTEGPPRGPLRLKDYTHLDVTKQNLLGQDSMVVGQSFLDADNLPPRAYARLRDYTWFSRFSLPDLVAHTRPGHHTLSDRALFIHGLSDRELFAHTLYDRSKFDHTLADQEMSL